MFALKLLPRRLLAALAVAVILFAGAPVRGALETVAGFFHAGAYEDARQALRQGGEGARPGEEILWQSRLATRPDDAVDLLQSGLADRGLPSVVRLRMALDVADIEYGREGYAAVLGALSPFLGGAEPSLPGEAYLKAGFSLRALGRMQQAREMLASIKPDDPAFVLARITLGDIGLEQDDPGLALNYYDSAERNSGSAASRLAAGRWRALRIEGNDEEADRVIAKLNADDPGSLALLEIRRLQRAEQEEMDARLFDEVGADGPLRAAEPGGRYALQLGAYSDRGRALAFQRSYRQRVPNLRIDEVRDAQGQFLYKVRTGSFVNPALARTEAEALARELNIEVIVADLRPDTRPAD